MAKTDLTKQLEQEIFAATSKMGTFGCFEVTIGWYGKERVDYLTYDTKGFFRCYEIKVSKADFYSDSAWTFCGDYNYFVMPKELFEEVKADIPKPVGVICDRCSVKRATRQECANRTVLFESMIRSLSRYMVKHLDSQDEYKIDRVRRTAEQYKRDRDNYYRKYWDLHTRMQQNEAEAFLDAIGE